MFKYYPQDADKNIPETPISPEHMRYLKKIRREKIIIRLTQLIILFLAFALWEIFARLRIVDPFITSQPSRLSRPWETCTEKEFFFSILG